MAHFIDYANATTLVDGAQTGFFCWIGFAVTSSIGSTIFEGRNKTLWYINMGYNLVQFVLIGVLLTLSV
jgi:hypothetical protein